MKEDKLNILQKSSIHIIKKYQKYLSPDHSIFAKNMNKPPYCRHYPSCSNYMIESIEKKWFFKWFIKWFFRILRCMPWSKWWYDPVDKNDIKK